MYKIRDNQVLFSRLFILHVTLFSHEKCINIHISNFNLDWERATRCE